MTGSRYNCHCVLVASCDLLQVTNDSEWQEAIQVASYQNYCNHQTVNLKVTVSEVSY